MGSPSKTSGQKWLLLGTVGLSVLASLAAAQGAQDPFPSLNPSDTSVLGATSSAATSASATSAASSAATSAGTTAAPTNTAPPAATSAGASSTNTGNPAFPTLAGVGVPELIVPDTSAASYMQKSSLPEGTVFICVGAILGFLGACVLAWHGMVAWSIRRSVQNAAKTSHGPDAKSIFNLGGLTNNGPTYHSMYGAGNMSLDNLSKSKTSYTGAGGAKDRDPSRNRGGDKRKSRQQASQSGLFFSPTANPGAGAARNSTHMPPGYYAAGTSQMGNQGYGRMPSVDTSPSNSRPSSRHMRPGSSGNPFAAPSPVYGDGRRGSRLNPDAHGEGRPRSQARPSNQQEGRAPSQYMEDLFSDHGGR